MEFTETEIKYYNMRKVMIIMTVLFLFSCEKNTTIEDARLPLDRINWEHFKEKMRSKNDSIPYYNYKD